MAHVHAHARQHLPGAHPASHLLWFVGDVNVCFVCNYSADFRNFEGTVLITYSSCVSHYVHPLGVDNILLTVLGFVVSLAISLRSTTAYERYSEGRRYWAQLMLVSQTLAREIWVSAEEREGEEGKEDVLGKLYVTYIPRLDQ